MSPLWSRIVAAALVPPLLLPPANATAFEPIPFVSQPSTFTHQAIVASLIGAAWMPQLQPAERIEFIDAFESARGGTPPTGWRAFAMGRQRHSGNAGNARAIHLGPITFQSAKSGVLSQFVTREGQFEMTRDGRTLLVSMLTIEGKTYFQIGDRWLQTETDIHALPWEHLFASEFLIGNPTLRRFLNISTVKPSFLSQPLPDGLVAVTELESFMTTRYSDDDRDAALATLHRIRLVARAADDVLTPTQLALYIDALVVISHQGIGAYPEYSRALEELKIYLAIAPILKRKLSEPLRKVAAPYLIFCAKRKLGFPQQLMDQLAKPEMQALIKTKPDNYGVVLTADGKIVNAHLANDVMWVRHPTPAANMTSHSQSHATSEIAIAGEASRVLEGTFRGNKMMNPVIRIRKGKEAQVRALLRTNGIHAEIRTRGNYSYVAITPIVAALNPNSIWIGGAATLSTLAEMLNQEKDLMTQVLVHPIREDGTFDESQTALGGHGDTVIAVTGKRDIISDLLRNGKVWRHVQGDDIGNQETGSKLAYATQTGKAVLVVTVTPQKLEFAGSDQTLITHYQKQLAEVRLILNQATASSDAVVQRDLWIKAMELYTATIYDPITKGSGIKIEKNAGGHLLEIGGENTFVENSQYTDTIEMKDSLGQTHRFPKDVFLALIPRDFNTNNFTVDPLAVAANRDRRIKAIYHSFLVYAHEAGRDAEDILARRRAVEKEVVAIINSISDQEWHALNLAFERFMLAIFPPPCETKNGRIKINKMAQNVAAFEATMALRAVTAEDINVEELKEMTREAAAAGKRARESAAQEGQTQETELASVFLKAILDVKNSRLSELLKPASILDHVIAHITTKKVVVVPPEEFSQVKDPSQFSDFTHIANENIQPADPLFEDLTGLQREAVSGLWWAEQAEEMGLLSPQTAKTFKESALRILDGGQTPDDQSLIETALEVVYSKTEVKAGKAVPEHSLQALYLWGSDSHLRDTKELLDGLQQTATQYDVSIAAMQYRWWGIYRLFAQLKLGGLILGLSAIVEQIGRAFGVIADHFDKLHQDASGNYHFYVHGSGEITNDHPLFPAALAAFRTFTSLTENIGFISGLLAHLWTNTRFTASKRNPFIPTSA